MSFRIYTFNQDSLLSIIYPEGVLYVPTYESNPPVSSAGRLYYNTTDDSIYLSSGVNTWVNITSGGYTLPAPLQSIADLTTTGNELIYTQSSNNYATTSITPAGRSFLTLSSADSQRTALGLEIGVNVQAQSSILNSLNSIASVADFIPYSSAGIYVSTPITSWVRSNLLTATSASNLNSTLSTVIAGTISNTNKIPKISATNTITQSNIDIDASNSLSGINDISIGGNLTITGNLAGLTPSILTQLSNINTQVINSTQWGYIEDSDQPTNTTSSPTFAGATFTGNVGVGSNSLTISKVPVSSTDVTNKQYVDLVAGSGIFPLQSANVATTTALPAVTYSAGSGTLTVDALTTSLTIDGVTITASDGKRIVVIYQVATEQNGVYTRTADVASKWVLTRTSDFNTAPIQKNTYIFVTEGNTNISSSWILSSAVTQFNPIVAGSAVNWTLFSFVPILSPGDGLANSGTTWYVDATNKFKFTATRLDLETVGTTYGGTGVSLAIGDSNKVLVTNVTDGTQPLNVSKTSPSGDFVGTSDSQALTNKTMTSNTNNIISRGLFSGSGSNTVSTYSATNPSAGQVLTAVNATTASWQTPVQSNYANTLYVSKNGTNVSPSYSTLAAAILDPIATGATSTTPCLIEMYPGTYTEVNPLTIPAYCSITGITATQNTVVIKASVASNPILILPGFTRIDSLVLDGNIGGGTYASIGILSSGTAFSTDLVYNTTSKNCSDACIKVAGNGAQYSKILICKNTSTQALTAGTTISGYECSAGGILSGVDFTATTFLSGGISRMTNGFYCHDDYSYMDVSVVQISSVENGIQIGSSTGSVQTTYPNFRCVNGRVSLYTGYGLYLNNKCNVRVASFQIETNEGADYVNQISVYSVNPALPSEPNLFAQLWLNARIDKINYNGGATNNPISVIGSNLSETPTDIVSSFIGDFSVGTTQNPSDSYFGEGNHYFSGMIVFTYDANTNTSTDRTADALLPSTTFPAFASPLANGNALYIAGDSKFSGTEINLNTIITLSAGTTQTAIAWEFWNGTTWTSLSFMQSLSQAPYTSFANNSFGVSGSPTKYDYRYGSISTWVNTLVAPASIVLPVGVADTLRYYVRARLTATGVTNVSTIPVISTVRLIASCSEMNSEGYLVYYGNARPRSELQIQLASFAPTGIAGETIATSQRLIACTTPATISLTIPNSVFANAVTTTIAAVISDLPFYIDTSLPVTLLLVYSRSVGSGNDVVFVVNYCFTVTNDVIGNTTGSPTATSLTSGPVISTVSATNRGQTSYSIPLNFQTYNPNTMTTWIKLSRLGNDASDTYNNTIQLISATLTYHIWANGIYSSSI